MIVPDTIANIMKKTASTLASYIKEIKDINIKNTGIKI